MYTYIFIYIYIYIYSHAYICTMQLHSDISTKGQELGDQKVYFVTYENIASFVGDIARAELLGSRPTNGQRLWYGPGIYTYMYMFMYIYRCICIYVHINIYMYKCMYNIARFVGDIAKAELLGSRLTNGPRLYMPMYQV